MSDPEAAPEDWEPINESRCDLPCGCSRYGEGRGVTTDVYCTAHRDFQEAVRALLAVKDAELAALRAEVTAIRGERDRLLSTASDYSKLDLYSYRRALKEAGP